MNYLLCNRHELTHTDKKVRCGVSKCKTKETTNVVYTQRIFNSLGFFQAKQFPICENCLKSRISWLFKNPSMFW